MPAVSTNIGDDRNAYVVYQPSHTSDRDKGGAAGKNNNVPDIFRVPTYCYRHVRDSLSSGDATIFGKAVFATSKKSAEKLIKTMSSTGQEFLKKHERRRLFRAYSLRSNRGYVPCSIVCVLVCVLILTDLFFPCSCFINTTTVS